MASVARYRERNKQAGLWKQAQNKRLLRSWLKKKKKKKERDYYTLHTHKYQYDMQYNRKRNTLTTSPKTHYPRLPIFISNFTVKQAQSGLGNYEDGWFLFFKCVCAKRLQKILVQSFQHRLKKQRNWPFISLLSVFDENKFLRTKLLFQIKTIISNLVNDYFFLFIWKLMR